MTASTDYDVVIIGSGPNGLSAANALVDQGLSVCVIEGKDSLGGGLRTEEVTLPGFHHDMCSAIHPMGVLSPYMRTLGLEDYGLNWCFSRSSVGHPMDDGPAVLLTKDLAETAQGLGVDKDAYIKLIAPFLAQGPSLLADLMAPLQIPKHPFLMARFGMMGLRPATSLANSLFKGERAKGIFGGCAAHSILPLNWAGTGALGLIFALTAHLENWPAARGGSASIAAALVRRFEEKGGACRTGEYVENLDDLPSSRFVLFDTSPAQLRSIAGDALPAGYRNRLGNYVYGPGVFKLDWALNSPIPWRDPMLRGASTVHLGGTLGEMAASEGAVWLGDHPQKPFVLLCQQSELDPSRAPEGKHTGYAYTHVPSGSTFDMTEAIESQVERFAPGFKDTVLHRRATNAKDFSQHNRNYVGGAIAGGAATLTQLFTRPVARLNPYTTPNPRLLICSASTPPGGGVHGMCGYYAAKTVLKRMGLPISPLYRDPFQLAAPGDS